MSPAQSSGGLALVGRAVELAVLDRREQAAAAFDDLLPLERHASPEEIAAAVLHLATTRARSSPGRRCPRTVG